MHSKVGAYYLCRATMPHRHVGFSFNATLNVFVGTVNADVEGTLLPHDLFTVLNEQHKLLSWICSMSFLDFIGIGGHWTGLV